MIEILTVPLSEPTRFGHLFENAVCAEGTYSWFQSLAATTLDSGEEAIAAVILENGVAKAGLPLARKGSEIRALTAPYTTLYRPAFSEPRWAHLLGLGASSYVEGSLRLDAIDPADPCVKSYLQAVKSSGLVTAQYRHFVNHYEPIRDFAEYWDARPSRLKATVRRKLARAKKHGAGFLCHREDFEKALTIYEDIYRASWKVPEPYAQFLPDMVKRLSSGRLVRLGVMMLGKEPVAAQIWLVCEGKGTMFKLAHREDAGDLSPGTLLTHWMIETLVREDALQEIDFGRGGDPYKSDWLSRQRPRMGLLAGNWKSAAGLRVIANQVLPTRLSFAVRKALGQIGRHTCSAGASVQLANQCGG